MAKKNSRKAKKKTKQDLRPNILWKALFFCFFVFLIFCFFWFFGFLMLCFFLPLFLFFCFSYGLSPKEKSNCWVVPLNLEKIVFSFFRHTLKKNNPLPAFGIDNFHKKMPIPRAGPEINFKLLSLKTGLVQREVALFLWTPGFFKGKKLAKKKIYINFQPSVKQNFFKKEKGVLGTEQVRWRLSFKKTFY